MTEAVLVIGLVLLITLVVAGIALRVDAREKRLEQRLATVTDIGLEDHQAPEPPRSIRASRPRGARITRLVTMALRLPIGLPLANVMPVWLVFVIAIAAGFAAGWGANFILSSTLCWLVGIGTAILLARGLFGWEVDRYRKKLLQQMPDAVELVVSATRAGLPLAEAFRGLAREMPSPTREEFAQMVSEMSLGAPPEEVLMSVHRRTQVTEYAIFAVTVAVQMRSGGRLAETIQNLAETVRQRLAVAQRAEALAAEAKLSSRIISVLPFVGGALMTVIQPGSLGPLFHDPRGKRLVAFGAVTLILGMFTMHKMIRGVTRD